MTNLFDLQQTRRSIYALGNHINLSEEAVSDLIFKTGKFYN